MATVKFVKKNNFCAFPIYYFDHNYTIYIINKIIKRML